MTQEVINQIDSINITLNAGGMEVINIVLAFVMYGVALGIKPHTFVEIAKNPKSAVLGVVCQIILLPLLTFLLTLVFGTAISWSMALGMILVASCPGGNISNFFSSYSKANIELSVCLTALSTSLAIFATPFNFWFYGNMYLKYINKAGMAAGIPYLEIPLPDVFKTIVILLGIPLVLGVLTSQFLPKIAEKLKKPFQYLSLIFFAVLVVLSFMGNIDAFLKCIKYIALVVFIHNLLALLIGYTTARSFRLPEKDKRTLTIETGIQNSGLGLVLLLGTSVFAGLPPHGGMLVITAWWGIWHIISGFAVSSIFKFKDRKNEK